MNAASTEPSFLDSNTQFEGAVLEGLPSDQWKADVIRLEGYTRSYLQNTVLMRITGYNVETELLRRPEADGEKYLCRRQKVVEPAGFVNIGVVSVLLILAFAGFAATLDFVILRCLIYHDNFRHPFRPALQDWIEDGLYQIQRSAYETAYPGASWSDRGKEIPVTLPGKKFRHNSSVSLGLHQYVLDSAVARGGSSSNGSLSIPPDRVAPPSPTSRLLNNDENFRAMV